MLGRKGKPKRKRQKVKPVRHIEQNGKSEKSYFKTFVVLILLASGIIGLVAWTEPNPISIAMFLILLFFILLIALSVLLANTRRGLLATAVIIIFLILRIFNLGNLLNLALLTGVAFSFEIYSRG